MTASTSPLRVPAEALAEAVTGRGRSLLADDLRDRDAELRAQVEGRSVLVVGGAGSIGSSTVRELARLGPRSLHVVDTDENGLTELVRDLRSQGALPEGTTLRTTPVDAGSPTMTRLMAAGRHDLVLNFAAVKHVRSEKDALSLLRMLEVNVRTARRVLEQSSGAQRYFAVSTDKAANPVNLMGATKRAMEHVVLDPQVPTPAVTARFANVAFSQGSLLEGWLTRLAKGQPLAVPEGVRRYFVSLPESGQLCLLAALCGPDGEVVVPDLDPARHLRDLVEVLQDVLGVLGLRPTFCRDEDEARAAVRDRPDGTWPVLLTPLDTAGEKEFEEFAGAGEQVHGFGLSGLRALRPAVADPVTIGDFLAAVSELLDDARTPVDEERIEALVGTLVPELVHRRSDRSLDQRM